MGTANPMPANASRPPGAASDTTTPMTRPRPSSSGPPELPGLTEASNWISPRTLAGVGLRAAVKPGDHAGGHAVRQAERVADRDDGRPDVGGSAEGRGNDDLRQRCRSEHGDVQLGFDETTVARVSVPSAKVTVMADASAMTWFAVMIVPLSATMMPVPEPPPAWMTTTEGATRW